MSHGRPGARGAEPWVGTRLRTPAPPCPARCGCSPDLAPQPAGPAPGRRTAARPYRGGGQWGVLSSRLLPAGGNRGEGGGGVGRGTVRCPEPSARSGSASRSLQQRRPSQTRAPGVASRAPKAPAPRKADLRHLARRTPGDGVVTHQSQRLLTPELPLA